MTHQIRNYKNKLYWTPDDISNAKCHLNYIESMIVDCHRFLDNKYLADPIKGRYREQIKELINERDELHEVLPKTLQRQHKCRTVKELKPTPVRMIGSGMTSATRYKPYSQKEIDRLEKEEDDRQEYLAKAREWFERGRRNAQYYGEM